jgi:hypothetical protein
MLLPWSKVRDTYKKTKGFKPGSLTVQVDPKGDEELINKSRIGSSTYFDSLIIRNTKRYST